MHQNILQKKYKYNTDISYGLVRIHLTHKSKDAFDNVSRVQLIMETDTLKEDTFLKKKKKHIKIV